MRSTQLSIFLLLIVLSAGLLVGCAGWFDKDAEASPGTQGKTWHVRLTYEGFTPRVLAAQSSDRFVFTSGRTVNISIVEPWTAKFTVTPKTPMRIQSLPKGNYTILCSEGCDAVVDKRFTLVVE